MRRRLSRPVYALTTAVLGTLVAVSGPPTVATARPASAVEPTSSPPALIGVRGTTFVDGHGREVVLRGFNVSGTVKEAEHGFLPFADAADARRSALAMKELTGANSVRFLLSWAAVEPSAGRYDENYLRRVTEQAGVFADLGMVVFFDYHQDLYSRYLFNPDSWYSGDGAPAWVVAAGNYPRENCGICFQWGQNITQNVAVQNATYDFWHNRALQAPAGTIGVQDAFLRQAQVTLTYLRTHLTVRQFAHVVGFDPLNEPYAGRYDRGQGSRSWERDVLLPFYLRFRAIMDAAGWRDRPAFIEPNMFWNGNLSLGHQMGGFLDAEPLGSRFVFNSHFYDQKAMSGIFMWEKAADGQHSADVDLIRRRGVALDTPAVVSEFGHPLTGYTSDKAPSIGKAMYQALDSRLPGARWWSRPGESGTVLSGTHWHWDIYAGRHREAMNDNPKKVLTEADAWNGEDFSSVAVDDAGRTVLRQDARLLDRIYPAAVAGHSLAFTYEDRSRDGATTMTWNPVPAGLPAVRTLVGDGRYAVLVWRGGGDGAPTELRLPAHFTPTVVSDVTATVQPRTLQLAGGGPAGALHYALVTDTPVAPADLLTAARREVSDWAAESFPG